MYDDLSLPPQSHDLAWATTPRGRRMARLRLLLATIPADYETATSQLMLRYLQHRQQQIVRYRHELWEDLAAYSWPTRQTPRTRWSAFEDRVNEAKG